MYRKMQESGLAETIPLIGTSAIWGFPGGLEVKASAWNVGDPGSIPGSGRSPEKEMATHSSTLAEKFCGLQFMGSQRVGHE